MQEQNLGSGLWVKTHFYRKGHMLHSVTYCVARGNPEVIRLAIDLRPIADMVKKYHQKLHEEGRSNPDSHAAKENVSGFFDFIEAPFKGIGHAIAHLAKSALLKSAMKAIEKVAHGAERAAGTLVHVAEAVTPYHLVKALIEGQRIDKALLSDLHSKLQAVHEVAPYASTVLSMVPGIGSTAAGAIAASAALASGQPITEALEQGLRAAVPGGAGALAAFDAAKKVVRGGNVLHAVVDGARNAVAPQYRAAFDVGFAVAHARKLQDVLKAGASGVASGVTSGLKLDVSRVSPAALAAFNTAHAALDALEAGEIAHRAATNVASSNELVRKAEEAVKRVGPAIAQAELQKNPALAAKLKNAVAIKNAGAKIAPSDIAGAIENAKAVTAQLQTLAAQAKSDPDPTKREAAKKSLVILEIVSNSRQHVSAVAVAHKGGIPGIQIDASGRLTRGRFAHTTTGPLSYLYTHHGTHGGRGQWSRVSTDTAPAPAQALAHAELAKAHHAAANEAAHKGDKSTAEVHRKQAAHHARAALANAKKAKPQVSGFTQPGLIGCGSCSH